MSAPRGAAAPPEAPVALVTGGGAGIGAAVASALRRDGCSVVVTGRGAARPEGLAPEIGYLRLDWLDDAATASALKEVREGLKPDILVNNAGINEKASIGDVEPEALDRILAVNLAGPYRLAQACLERMTARGWGRIVNITSIWSQAGNPGNSAYCASKFGLDGFSAALAAEVARKGVLVNCVAPGYVLTETLRRKYSPELIAEISESIPLRRMISPEEVAELVAFLAGPRNGCVTGQNILADGGLTRTTHPWREW